MRPTDTRLFKNNTGNITIPDLKLLQSLSKNSDLCMAWHKNR